MIYFFRPTGFKGPGFFEKSIGVLQSIGRETQVCFADFERSRIEEQVSVNGHYNLIVSWGFDKRYVMDDAFFQEIRDDINTGKCRVFLDKSNEPGTDLIGRSSKYFSRLGIAPDAFRDNVFFICQNRRLNKHTKNNFPFDAWFLLTLEYFLKWTESVEQRNLLTDQDRFLNHSHRYVCLNKRLRPHRILTMCLLNYLDQVEFENTAARKPSFLSMPYFPEIPAFDPELDSFNLAEFIDTSEERLPGFAKSVRSLSKAVPIRCKVIVVK